jgi:hypothetical protein
MKSAAGYFIFFILLFPSFNLTAQEKNFVTNVTKELNIDKNGMMVTYDLNSPDTSQLFDVELKIHYENRIIQPKNEEIRGEFGYKVRPGREKIILWEMPSELVQNFDKVTPEVIAVKSTGASADFDFKTTSQIPPFEVKFNNKSINSDRFQWNFGDSKSLQNNFSTEESPVHIYRSTGKYNVGLITSNSKNNTQDTLIKVVSLVRNDEIRKHKNLKTVWLTSAVASAGIGVYGIIRHNNIYNEWKEKGTSELEKKYKTYRIVGPAGLAVSAICISQVISQSKKVREAEKKFSFNIIPSENGLITRVSINF